jgi:hypothetical protein
MITIENKGEFFDMRDIKEVPVWTRLSELTANHDLKLVAEDGFEPPTHGL